MNMDYDDFTKTQERAADCETTIKAVQKQVNVAVLHTALEDCGGLRLGPADLFLTCAIYPQACSKKSFLNLFITNDWIRLFYLPYWK